MEFCEGENSGEGDGECDRVVKDDDDVTLLLDADLKKWLHNASLAVTRTSP